MGDIDLVPHPVNDPDANSGHNSGEQQARETAGVPGRLTRELFEAVGLAVTWGSANRGSPPATPKVEPPAILSNTRSAAQFEKLIRTAWQSGVGSIVEVGDLLRQARDELQPEDFKALRLPFGRRTVQMLVKIAANSVLSDPANHGSLPPCWRTLYELTKIDKGDLESAIAEGVVHPDMQRKNAVVLRHDDKGEGSSPRQRLTKKEEAQLVKAWSAASSDARRAFFLTKIRPHLFELMTATERDELEHLVLGNAKAHATTKKQRNAIGSYLELKANPTTNN
jgi:hypothetical protein